MARATPLERGALVGAVYDLAWPVVFGRLTRGMELQRGHTVCSTSVRRLADGCLDRFHDDVEAVIDYALRHANVPIRSLEAWIASRLTAATVDGHRRRRGLRGALQRPRLPRWLSHALGEDRWLVELATQMLVWVGVAATAGAQVWPLDAWAGRRAAVTGDWRASDPAVVVREIEVVLAAMQRRPSWYADHVEVPLGRKPAPVASWSDVEGRPVELPGSTLAGDVDDSRLVELAAEAVDAIDARLRAGEDRRAVVVDVLRVVFAGDGGIGELDRVPFAGPDHGAVVRGLLDDPARAARLVSAVLAVMAEVPERPSPG